MVPTTAPSNWRCCNFVFVRILIQTNPISIYIIPRYIFAVSFFPRASFSFCFNALLICASFLRSIVRFIWTLWRTFLYSWLTIFCLCFSIELWFRSENIIHWFIFASNKMHSSDMSSAAVENKQKKQRKSTWKDCYCNGLCQICVSVCVSVVSLVHRSPFIPRYLPYLIESVSFIFSVSFRFIYFNIFFHSFSHCIAFSRCVRFSFSIAFIRIYLLCLIIILYCCKTFSSMVSFFVRIQLNSSHWIYLCAWSKRKHVVNDE